MQRINKKVRIYGLKFSLEQVMGIEPTLIAWKAIVLPLNYTCKWTQIDNNKFLKTLQLFLQLHLKFVINGININ